MNGQTITGQSVLSQAIRTALRNVETPTESQLKYAANVEFVLEHGGGGGGDQPLNIINQNHPLTGPLDLSSQALIVRAGQSAQEACSVGQLTSAISNEANARSNADTTLQQNINSEASTRQSADQNLQVQVDNRYVKYVTGGDKSNSSYNALTVDQLISSGGLGAYSLDEINNAKGLQGPLILSAQPVIVGTPLLATQASNKQYVDGLIFSEASTRQSADQNLQEQVDNRYIKYVTGGNKTNSTYNASEIDSLVVTQSTDQIKASNDPTSRRVITQASEFVALQNVVKQTINETKMVSNIPICYSSYLPQTENFQLTTHEDLSNLQGQLNTEVSDRIAADQNLQEQVDVEEGRITDLSNNTYRKWVTGANKDTTTYNASQIDAQIENPNNYPPLNIIQRFVPLNDYFDLRIGNQPTYCQTPVEDPQIVPKSYVDTSISNLKLNSASLAPNASVNLANQRIVGLSQPVNAQDAANKSYVDEQISSLQQPLNITNSFYPLSTDLSFLTNDYNLLVKNPTQNAHPTTRQYVDTQIDNERAARQDKDDQLQAGLNNRYIKYLTGGDKNNSTYNASQIDSMVQNPDNVPPLNVIQSVTPLNSYLDLRISNYPTYCVQPTENDQLANKVYVDNKVSALKLNTVQSPDGSVGFNSQRLTQLGNALNGQDAINLQQAQQLVTEATTMSLAQINQNYSSVGQVLNLQGVDVRVESQNITNVDNPISLQFLSDQLANYYPTSTTLDQITLATSPVDFNQQAMTNVTSLQADGNLSLKTNGASGSLVVSSVNSNYTISNNNNIDLQTNGILTLNAGQYTQSTTPLYSNSTANQSPNQVLNRGQNDGRYYQSNTRVNEIQSAAGNIVMNGFTLENIRDAVDILEPTNLAQVTSLIANSGFKNKIQSQSNHAQVICDQGSDIVEIKANNADSTIVIQASGSDYTLSNTGKINLQASELNVNQNALRVVGDGGASTILLTGDIRSSALDLDLPDQILTREQNDVRYLGVGSTLSSIPPPDSSVSFANQLIRNVQSPILGTDASTKAYIDNTLINYPTIVQVDSRISSALVPYSTSAQIASTYLTQSNAASTYITPAATDTKISTALVPYLTQASAASIYRPLSSPDNKIQSTDGNTQLLAQTGSSGFSIKANNVVSGSLYTAVGQTGFNPLVLQAVDKLQLVSQGNSFSMTSPSSNGLYIASNSDVQNQLQYNQIVVGSGTNRQGLVLSSGHTETNVPYNAISSNTTSSLQSLTITPETALVASQGGNQLTMYGNSVAGLFGIQNQFNKPVGRTTTQTSALANEFLTKGLADTLYTGGGGGGSQIIDSGSNNSVTCTASNPGVILTNLQNILTSVQLGSATSTGVGISFQSASGATGGINALSGANYIEHISNGQGFKFMNNLGSGYMFLKSAAKATSDGTSQVVFIANPQVSSSQTTPLSNELIQAQYADARYSFKDTALNNLAQPSGNLSLNSFLVTNLASGTIASGNTSSVTGGNVYDYIATLPSVITQQVYTVTVFGSTTNGFQWTAFTNATANNTVQCQRVKGSGAQMITSSVITSQSQTLVPDFTTLQFQVANASVRVTQVVPYTLTAFSTPGQQNIASMTFSQQAISSTATCVQLYKPQGAQGGAAFILYVYVDQF